MQSEANFGDNNQGVQIGYNIDLKDPLVKRQKITEWLAPVNFLQKQNDVFSTRQPGTGHWFLNSKSFKDWQSGKNTVLWCHSIAGSGKTVLISIAVDYLQELYKEDPEVGVACVYCEYKQQGLQTPTNLLASIWRQLDQWKDESNPEVQAAYNRRGRFGTKPALDEVVSILRLEIWRHSVIYIMIDALDECVDDNLTRNTLVTKIQKTITANSPRGTRIQLLVTSRSPDNIFSKGVKMQVQAAEEDIKSFVSQRLIQGISRSVSISEDVRKNEKLKRWIINIVVEKVDKIFLMARLHLDSLKYKTNLGDLREAVRYCPQGLDELYKDTWTRIADQDLEWRTLANQTLGWLSSAFRQLKVEELRHALTVKSGDTVLDTERLPAVDVICESCHGLVTFDDESQIVRLVHRTAQDFFDRHRAQYLPDIHNQITRTCLDYLMLDVFAQGPCDFISSRPTDMGVAEGDISEITGEFMLVVSPSTEMKNTSSDFCDPLEIWIAFQVQYSEINFGGTQYASDRALNTSGSLSLHVAVSFGLEHIVNVLLEKLSSSEINGLDRRGKTALHWAVLSGSESLTLLLLKAGAKIDTQVKTQYSELHRQTSMGFPRATEAFLSKIMSRPIEVEMVHNEKILGNAVRFDMKKVIEMHINSAANTAEKKDRANGVSWKASSLGKIDMLEVSFSKPRISVRQGPRRAKDQTALLMAVENGRLGATLALLSRGALISATDRFGKNALQTAVTSTNIFDERLSIIHNQGSSSWFSPVTQIPDNIPPSQLSRSGKDYRDKLSRVLALGQNPSFDALTEPFLNFEAALHEDNDQEQITNQLLDSGADITVRTPQNQTLLHLAVSSYPRLLLLLDRAAGLLTIDSCDNTGRTALHYAAAAGNYLAFDLLLAYGADVTARDPKGATALHLGVLSPYSVRAALEHGVGANATDNLGRTPMHYLLMLHKWSKHDFKTYRTQMRNAIMLSEYAGENAVKFLEKAGARDLQDASGLRPMDYIEAPFTAQIEMRETARWISDNEERYRLSREVVAYHFNNLKVSDAELGQGWMDEMFREEPSWRIVPDEVSASPSELD